MSETKLSAEIRDMIRREYPQIWLQRLQSGIILAKHGARIHGAEPGSPDYVGCLPGGRLIAIEVKTPTGTTQKARAELQATCHNRLRAMGAVAFITTGVDDCRQKLQEAMK